VRERERERERERAREGEKVWTEKGRTRQRYTHTGHWKEQGNAG
jgi:hypothetical protein